MRGLYLPENLNKSLPVTPRASATLLVKTLVNLFGPCCSFTVNIFKSSMPLYVVAQQGSYTDPLTKEIVSSSAGKTLRLEGVVNFSEGSDQKLMLTPLTNIVSGLAKYKISGGELRNEVKKELGKLSAKAIFEASRDETIRDNYINDAKKVIEASFNEKDNSEQSIKDSELYLDKIYEPNLRKLLSKCYQCVRCSGVCQLSKVQSFIPSVIIQRILEGSEDKVISSGVLWDCLTCNSCLQNCPEDINFADIVRNAKYKMKNYYKQNPEDFVAHKGVYTTISEILSEPYIQPNKNLDWVPNECKISDKELKFYICLSLN